jgi:endonuclease/exonuclease/phosphatase family metal-dependent hydrolase
MLRTLSVGTALVLAACTHGTPKDLNVETTFPAVAKTPDLPKQLRVVTFNLHMEPGSKIERGLRGDPALRDADLIFFEEVHRDGLGCSAACAIARDLGFYAVYAPGHANGDGDDGVAIVSRSPITSAQVIQLPFYNVHFNGGRRIALAATVEIAGRPVTVYAVHLENRLTVNDRRHQMLPVLEHAERQHTPVIIAGDFNTSPFTWIAHVIPIPTGTQDDRFEELVRAHGFATPLAHSGPTHHHLWMKLDGIYTRGFATQHYATARAHDVSDHLALWAEMTENEAPPGPAASLPATAPAAPATIPGATTAMPTATAAMPGAPAIRPAMRAATAHENYPAISVAYDND